jgi:hypothetical protein
VDEACPRSTKLRSTNPPRECVITCLARPLGADYRADLSAAKLGNAEFFEANLASATSATRIW